MNGPWEDYATGVEETPETGPWSEFASAPVASIAPQNEARRRIEETIKQRGMFPSLTDALTTAKEKRITRDKEGRWQTPALTSRREDEGFVESVVQGVTGTALSAMGRFGAQSPVLSEDLDRIQRETGLSDEQMQAAWDDLGNTYREFDEDEKLRINSDGSLIPNAAVSDWLDTEKAKALVEASGASPEAKARTIAALPQLQTEIASQKAQAYEAAASALKSAEIPARVALAVPVSPPKSPSEWAEEKGRTDIGTPQFVRDYEKDVIESASWVKRKTWGLTGRGVLSGAKVANTLLGITGLAGSETAGRLAAAGTEASATIGRGLPETGLLGAAVEESMSIGLQIVTGRLFGVAGAAVGTAGTFATAGAQSAGLTYADELAQGTPEAEAREKAAKAGVTTAVITAAFGTGKAGGVERAAAGTMAQGTIRGLLQTAREEGVGNVLRSPGLRSLAKDVLIAAGAEGAEEGIDQLLQAFITAGPDTDLADAWSQAVEAAKTGAFIGGAVDVGQRIATDLAVEAMPDAPLAAEEALAEPQIETDEKQIEEASGLPPVEGQPVEQAPAVQAEEGAAQREGEGPQEVTDEPDRELPVAPETPVGVQPGPPQRELAEPAAPVVETPPAAEAEPELGDAGTGLQVTEEPSVVREQTDLVGEQFVEIPAKKLTIADPGTRSRAFGNLREDGVFDLSGIDAKPAIPFSVETTSVFESSDTLKGSRLFERVIAEVRNRGASQLRVKMQSKDTRKVLARLVEKGVLSNPREIVGSSTDEHPTFFDIAAVRGQTEPAAPVVEAPPAAEAEPVARPAAPVAPEEAVASVQVTPTKSGPTPPLVDVIQPFAKRPMSYSIRPDGSDQEVSVGSLSDAREKAQVMKRQGVALNADIIENGEVIGRLEDGSIRLFPESPTTPADETPPLRPKPPTVAAPAVAAGPDVAGVPAAGVTPAEVVIPRDTRDTTYEKLLAKGKPAGPNMVELTDAQVPPAIRKKLASERDVQRGLPGKPAETTSFYLRPKAEVTGVPTDRGWILKDKRPDFIARSRPATPQVQTPAAPSPATPRTMVAEFYRETADRLERQAGQTATGGKPVGSGNVRERISADVLRSFIRSVESGTPVEQAAEAARQEARELIATHNARRPGDKDWKIDPGSSDKVIRDAAADFSDPAALANSPWAKERSQGQAPTAPQPPFKTYSEWLDTEGEKSVTPSYKSRSVRGVDVDRVRKIAAGKNAKIQERNKAGYNAYVEDWVAKGGNLSNLSGENDLGEDVFKATVSWVAESRGREAAEEMIKNSDRFRRDEETGRWVAIETPAQPSSAPVTEPVQDKTTAPQPYSPGALKETFDVTDEQAVAINALVQAMGLDTSRIRLQRGGVPGDAAMRQEMDARDAAYLAAVEAGDMETAQRMVKEAAEAAGYRIGPTWHGTQSGRFEIFSDDKSGGRGFYFSKKPEYASTYAKGEAPQVISAFLRAANLMPMADFFRYGTEDGLSKSEAVKQARKDGFDGIEGPREFVVFSPSQIKSADPVTYDSDGNVIPLSKRFNPESPSILYQDDSTPGHEMTREAYDASVAKIKPKPREVFYVGDVEVIRNPSDSDRRRMSSEVRSEFGRDISGDPATRFTKDEFGNTWIWKSHQGIHSQIEPGISSREGVPVNQNSGVPTHAELVRDAIRAKKPIPAEVQAQYPQYAEFFAELPLFQNRQGETASPFYSRLSSAIESADFGTSKAKPPAQWAGVIRKWAEGRSSAGGALWNKGISKEELKWSGIMTWLESQKRPLTKAEVLDHLRNEGAVRFEEVRSQPDESMGAQDFRPHVLPGGENYREVVLAMPHTTKPQFVIAYKDGGGQLGGMTFDTREQAEAEMAETFPRRTDLEIQPFYREKPVSDYTSTHFPTVPNYVAHMRTNERVDADGKRGLFIEEIQSDRHQEGRKKGYKGDEDRTKPPHGSTIQKRGNVFRVEDPNGRSYAAGATEQEAIANAWVNLQGNDLRILRERGVADAPFRKDWPLQMFKRALRDAVASGKGWIGWTVGDTQNDRFDLSKQVDAILIPYIDAERRNVSIYLREDLGDYFALSVTNDGTVTSYDGRRPELNGKSLDDVIGKDMADKIMSATEEAEFRGDGLKVGGSGMKGFYDNMLPKEIGKYVKQWGGKVEKSNLPGDKNRSVNTILAEDFGYRGIGAARNAPEEIKEKAREMQRTGLGTPIWRIEITPEMRASVERGQPLFQQRQDAKGSFEIIPSTGDILLRGLSAPDVSTGVHEIAHAARRMLLNRSIPAEARRGITDEDIAVAEEWAGAKNGVWNVDAEEKFARGMERYLRDGKAPVKKLQEVFDKIGSWLREIYANVTGSPIDVEISDAMRAVFDKLVSRTVVLDISPTAPLIGEASTSEQPRQTGRRTGTQVDGNSPPNEESKAVASEVTPSAGVDASLPEYLKSLEAFAEAMGSPSAADPDSSRYDQMRLSYESALRERQSPVTPTETAELVALDKQIEQNLEPEIPAPDFTAPPLPPEQSPTSLKHAQVDADRERLGLPPRFRRPRYTDQAAWDRAIAAEDAWSRTNEAGTAGSALLDRLIREGPRALTKDEHALLLHEKLMREDAVEKSQAALNRAGADGREELQGRVKAALDRFNQLADYADAAGSASGLSLQARKMLVNRDYSLASVAREMHAAKNLNAKEPVPWTSADQAKAAEVAKKLQETQARLDTLLEENTELTAAVERLTRDVEQAQAKLGKQVRETRVRKLVKEKLDPLVAEARARLEARGKVRPSQPPPPPEAPLMQMPDARDAEYLAAVERGDMETAQRMVDEAARAAGYVKVIASFPEGVAPSLRKSGQWVSLDTRKGRDYQEEYAGQNWEQRAISGFVRDGAWDDMETGWARGQTLVLTEDSVPADPVTRDESGQVIPLSKRFNPVSVDIRYSGPAPEVAEDIRDMAIVGAGWLVDKILTVQEFGAKLVSTFGDWVKDHIDAVFAKSNSLFTETAESVSGGNAPTPEQVRDSIDPEEELTKQDVWELARAHVIAGARGRNVLENVFNDLSPLFPDLTRDRVAVLFTDYGTISEPSTKPVSQELQRVKSLERIALKIADVRAKQMPKRTGFQRGEQDAEIRELEKQFREEYRALEEEMRRKGIPFEDSERRLKTALGAVKRRMQNEIEELQRAIDARTPRSAAVRQPVEYDQAALDLRAKLEAKRAEYDSVFSKETTREKRVSAAIKSLDRQIAEEEKMLADGVLKKAKGEPVTSPEIEARREKLRRMRQNRRDLYAAANPDKIEAEALAAAKRAAQRSIERLGAAVASGDVAVKRRDPAYTPDAELLAMIEARETLSDMVAEMRRALPATPAQQAAREKRMLAAAEKTLEDLNAKLAAGDLSVKAARTPAAIPASVQAVREKIKSANRQLDARRREAAVGPYSMEAKIQRQLGNVNKRLAEYQRRIREKDFSKKTPAKPVTSPEILDAEFEAAKAKAQYQEMLNEYKLANASFGKKFGYYAFSTNNLLKLLTLGFDIGVLTRQLGTTYQSIVRDMGMFAPTPEGARRRADGSYVARTIRAGLQAFMDPRKELEIYKAVSTRPTAGWDKAAGLVFGAPFDDQAGTREDIPTANFIETIPWWVWPAIAGAKIALVGVSPPVAALLIGTSLVQKRLLIALDRAQRAMTNQSRALWFDHAMNNLPDAMQTAESAKVLGTAVMVGTGRGTLPAKLEGIVPAANMILLATRFYVSRIQSILYGFRTAADVTTGFLATPKATKAARQEVAKMYARSVTGRALLLTLGAMAFGKSVLGGDDEDEENGVVLDPFNPDFGRVKLSENVKLDFMSGINGFMGVMARVHFERRTDPETGRKEVLAPSDMSREVMNFFASKRNLQVSFLWNYHRGEFYGGKPANFENALEEATTAIIVNDTVTAFKELGPVKGAALTMLMLTGAGASVGDAAEEKEQREAARRQAVLERKRAEAELNR